MASFVTADYVILALTLVISLGIGIYHSIVACVKKERTTINDYLLGQRKLYWIPVGLSILVTFQSAVLITGVPGEVYVYGFSYVLFPVFGMLLSVVVTAFVFVPLLYPLKLTSAYEYLEMRFESKLARVVGSIIQMIGMILYMGVVIFAPSVAFTALSGFPAEASIVIVSIIATIYTAAGGMRAVVWTDVFQFSIMCCGILGVLIQGSIEVGGLANAWKISKGNSSREDRTKTFDVSPDPKVRHSVWALIIGGTFTWLGNIGVSQASVQRYISVPSIKAARGALLLSGPLFVVWGMLSSLAGIVMYAYFYRVGCDPLGYGILGNVNQIGPEFVGQVFHFLPGFAGLYAASLFSGALSTFSSGINGLGAITWEDMLKSKLAHLQERTRTWIIKLLVVCYGMLVMAVGFMALKLGGPATQIALKFFGACGGPLLGMFVLGGFFPCANWIGASLGGILGLMLTCWLTIGSYISLPPSPVWSSKLDIGPTNSCAVIYNLTTTTTTTAASVITTTEQAADMLEPFYRVSYMWYGAIGMSSVVVIGLIISFLTGPTKPSTVKPQLLIPVYDWYCCCLPASCRNTLQCGVPERHDEKEDTSDEKYTYENPARVSDDLEKADRTEQEITYL